MQYRDVHSCHHAATPLSISRTFSSSHTEDYYRTCMKSVDCSEQCWHLNIMSSNPWTQDIFPFVYFIFNFFQECFQYTSLSFPWLIPENSFWCCWASNSFPNFLFRFFSQCYSTYYICFKTYDSPKSILVYLDFFFLATLWGMRNLSSLTRDWTCALPLEAHWTAKKVLILGH